MKDTPTDIAACIRTLNQPRKIGDEKSMRILVADDQRTERKLLYEKLTSLGHTVAVCKNGTEVIEICKHAVVDIIFADIIMPEMGGMEAAEEVARMKPVPFILMSVNVSEETIAQTRWLGDVFLCLPKKLLQPDLLKLFIPFVKIRFMDRMELSETAKETQKALEDRIAIERAKEVLENREGMSPADAFIKIRQAHARMRLKEPGISMAEVARRICDHYELISPKK